MSELKAKKVARDTKLAADATKAKAEADKANAKLVTEITDKAKKYEAEYAALEKQAIDNRRKAKANNEIYVAPEDKVVFVIRVRGIIGISPKTKAGWNRHPN